MSDIILNDDEIEFLKESNYIEQEPGYGPAFDDAAAAWHDMRSRRELRAEDVLLCHAQLMRSRTSIPDDAKGAWTKVRTGVYSGSRLIQQNPDPSEVPGLMEKFIVDINADVLKFDLEAGANDQRTREFHARFEKIHPFQDGNGRVGRILYEWHRLMLGMKIHVIHEEDRAEYYSWFRKV